MNTFGLRRKINTFGLGELQLTVVQAYHEIIDFVLTIARTQNFKG